MGPGGGWLPEKSWLGLYGDETALPAIARMLAAAAPDSTGVAVIVISHANDVQVLGHPEGVSVKWLLRGRDASLIDELKALQLPEDQQRFVWFAGEKREVEAARKHLATLGLRKSEWQAAAYWVR